MEIPEIPDYSAPGVYVISNTENSRCYVGSSVNVKMRLKTHLNNMLFHRENLNSKISADIKTDSDISKFKFFVFEEYKNGEVTEEFLRQREKKLIEKYDTYKYGYNIAEPFSLSKNGNCKYVSSHCDDTCTEEFSEITIRIPRYKKEIIEQVLKSRYETITERYSDFTDSLISNYCEDM